MASGFRILCPSNSTIKIQYIQRPGRHDTAAPFRPTYEPYSCMDPLWVGSHNFGQGPTLANFLGSLTFMFLDVPREWIWTGCMKPTNTLCFPGSRHQANVLASVMTSIVVPCS